MTFDTAPTPEPAAHVVAVPERVLPAGVVLDAAGNEVAAGPLGTNSEVTENTYGDVFPTAPAVVPSGLVASSAVVPGVPPSYAPVSDPLEAEARLAAAGFSPAEIAGYLAGRVPAGSPTAGKVINNLGDLVDAPANLPPGTVVGAGGHVIAAGPVPTNLPAAPVVAVGAPGVADPFTVPAAPVVGSPIAQATAEPEMVAAIKALRDLVNLFGSKFGI